MNKSLTWIIKLECHSMLFNSQNWAFDRPRTTCMRRRQGLFKAISWGTTKNLLLNFTQPFGKHQKPLLGKLCTGEKKNNNQIFQGLRETAPELIVIPRALQTSLHPINHIRGLWRSDWRSSSLQPCKEEVNILTHTLPKPCATMYFAQALAFL